MIDPVCYISHDSRRADHAECARMCAKQGITLGILEENTGKIYISLPVDHSNLNTKLLDFIAKRVEVKGMVFRKGGLAGIFIQELKALGSPGKTTGSSKR